MSTLTRWLAMPAAAVAIVTLSGTAFTSAASASTTPPPSTSQERVEALVQPSLAYVAITASGEVDVPWGDGTTHRYTDKVAASCSGSVVESDGIILTAGHCADPAEYQTELVDDVFAQLQRQGLTGQLTQQYAEQNWTVPSAPSLSISVLLTAFASTVADATALPARILYDEPFTQGDVALLQIHAPTPLPALQAAGQNPADGTSVITAGYPGSVTDTVDTANLQPTLTPGQVTSTQTLQNVQFTGISSTLSPGMSGGPTLDAQGRIVGTNSFQPAGESQQLNFITSAAEVRRVLADNSVSDKLTPADQAWRTGLNDYYAGKYREAVQQFNEVLSAIPGERSAQQFKARAIADYPLESTGPATWLLALIAATATALAGATGLGLMLRQRRRHALANRVSTAPIQTPTEAYAGEIPHI
jgi:serine protease Do